MTVFSVLCFSTFAVASNKGKGRRFSQSRWFLPVSPTKVARIKDTHIENRNVKLGEYPPSPARNRKR